MSAKRQIFKLSTLKRLLNEENSCVSLVSCTKLLEIPPYYLNDMKGGVIFTLNRLLKKYDPFLNGIIIGYQNLTILWDENSGKIRMGAFEAELNVRVEFYVFQPRIGNILDGLVNKRSKNHIGCLVHRCFNATILRPEDVTYEDWICKDYNINDKVIFKVKDLDFTGSVPYMEGDIDENLFNQCKPSIRNFNCDIESTMVHSEEFDSKSSENPNNSPENSSHPAEKKKKKDGKKKKLNEEKHSLQINQLNALQSSNNALDINVNSEIRINESMKDNDTTAIVEKLTKINMKKNIKDEDEVDKAEENEVKKKKHKKNKKKVKESDERKDEESEIQSEDFITLTKEKCSDDLHNDGVKKDSINADFSKSKSKKKKKRKKDEPSQSEGPEKAMELTSVNEENDDVFYSTRLDPSKKSEKLNITFCSPILPEPLSGNKKRKKEKDKLQQVLESSLALAKKEEQSSTNDQKSKNLKRKKERESESEGFSTPKKYKNGNMYDVVYSPSPRKTYYEDKSLFSDSEKSFQMSSSKKEVKLNGDVHEMLEKCDTEKDSINSTVQSLLDEVRKEVSVGFQNELEIQNGKTIQDGEKNKKSKTVKVENKEEKTTVKKKKKKEKEKSKIRESEETTLTENTATSLYDKLLQDAMNSINITNDEMSSASSATKQFDKKKQRRKKKTKESVQA